MEGEPENPESRKRKRDMKDEVVVCGKLQDESQNSTRIETNDKILKHVKYMLNAKETGQLPRARHYGAIICHGEPEFVDSEMVDNVEDP